jgi:hypothetical protein
MRFRIKAAVVVAVGLALALATSLSAAAQAAPGAGWATGRQNIVNRYSGKCLQPQSLAPGALIIQRTCGYGTSQKWVAVPIGTTGYVQLRNEASGLCLDLQSNSEADVHAGTLAQQFWCSTEFTSEYWNRSPADGTDTQTFTVYSGIRGLNLDVRNRSKVDGALVQVWYFTRFEQAQQFRFVDVW